MDRLVPSRLAIAEFAAMMGVGIPHARNMLKRMGNGHEYAAWEETEAKFEALGEAALTEAAKSLDADDVEWAAAEEMPDKALDELVQERAWRTLRARAAANARWARVDDRTAATERAREAAMLRFEREVDPDGVLDLPERARRAAYARKAHMLKLALKSSKARRRRKEQQETA